MRAACLETPSAPMCCSLGWWVARGGMRGWAGGLGSQSLLASKIFSIMCTSLSFLSNFKQTRVMQGVKDLEFMAKNGNAKRAGTKTQGCLTEPRPPGLLVLVPVVCSLVWSQGIRECTSGQQGCFASHPLLKTSLTLQKGYPCGRAPGTAHGVIAFVVVCCIFLMSFGPNSCRVLGCRPTPATLAVISGRLRASISCDVCGVHDDRNVWPGVARPA
eukprot:1150545-Pelagomonas_calceolata.AAC.3